MILLASAAVAALFGAGVYLLLKHDVIKITVGTVLITHSAILFLVAAGFGEPADAIAPRPEEGRVSDPLAQALAITAIVIGFAVSGLLLKLGLGVQAYHHSIRLDDLARAERKDEKAAEERTP